MLLVTLSLRLLDQLRCKKSENLAKHNSSNCTTLPHNFSTKSSIKSLNHKHHSAASDGSSETFKNGKGHFNTSNYETCNSHYCSPQNCFRSSLSYGSCDYENDFQCLALNINPELGERIMISGNRALVEEVFPEISQVLMDGRTSVAWNQDSKHVIRFPLNGYCKLNSLQTIARLLNNGFKIMASNGGGVEGQQFSEYLFVRNQVSIM